MLEHFSVCFKNDFKNIHVHLQLIIVFIKSLLKNIKLHENKHKFYRACNLKSSSLLEQEVIHARISFYCASKFNLFFFYKNSYYKRPCTLHAEKYQKLSLQSSYCLIYMQAYMYRNITLYERSIGQHTIAYQTLINCASEIKIKEIEKKIFRVYHAYGQSESIISTKNSIFPFHLNSGLSLLCVVQLTYLVIFDFGVHYRLWDG